MSLNYSPEILRLLVAERLDEAPQARLARDGRAGGAASKSRTRAVAFARRLVGLRTSPAACGCA
jgi:hypothetical protein